MILLSLSCILSGVVFDGMARNLKQAKELDDMLDKIGEKLTKVRFFTERSILFLQVYKIKYYFLVELMLINR